MAATGDIVTTPAPPTAAPSGEVAADERFNVLAKNALAYLTPDDCNRLSVAYEFASEAHAGQRRKSGEPFIIHPLEVAIILSELHMDADTLVAAILHDTVEDTDRTLDDITAAFGESVALLVDGVTKISQIEVESLSEQQVNNLKKMLVAMSRDIRVIVIKLADRLHNMRTLMALKEDRRIFKAKETMEIYAPLANRLGMGSIKWELEDLSFFYLEPSKYQLVQKMVNETREAREAYLERAISDLRGELDAVGLEKAKITGRPKHLYSIYQKMSTKDKDFSEIYDLIGLRVIVDTIPECYSTLGAAHNLWHPIPGRFKDYIAMPKYNMYQSLHTTVMGPAARPLEIQIRTEEMHHMNEFGVAAHWRYKQGGDSSKSMRSFDEQLSWLREMLDWQADTDDPAEFMKNLKVDLFDSEVFCFTPKGEVVSLRAGSTPLDFAYAIHTEVGNHCVAAKVNGSIVPFTRELETGDRVEIVTQKNARPSRNWLTIVATPRARSKIRAYFSKMSRNDDLEHGREVLAKQMRSDGLNASSAKISGLLEKVAGELNYKKSDEVLIAVGAGKLSAKQVSHRIMRILSREAPQSGEATSAGAALERAREGSASTLRPRSGAGQVTGAGRREGVDGADDARGGKAAGGPGRSGKGSGGGKGVVVKGLDGVYVRLSKCCNPVPGDEIIGFITRGRGVSVHRADCPNADDLRRNAGQIIEVSWEGGVEASFQVEIVVEAIDRLRLLQDIVAFLADQGVNIVTSSTITHGDDIVEMRFLFEVSGLERMGEILEGVRAIDNVVEARRMLPGDKKRS